jgi:F-type H+-transporting ATPase subunit a
MEERIWTIFGSIGGHNQVWMVLTHLILTIGIVLFIARKASAKLQLVPTGAQNMMEAYLQGVIAMGADTMGAENARKFIPLIATLGLVIFIANMMGIVPGFESVTANINFTLTLAIIVFIYYNYLAFKEQGIVKYIKHMMGPVPVLAPLMLPIEIVSHLSRIVSLAFRLFGSIKGDDMFTLVLLMLVPWIAPLPGFFFLFAFGILQAFIFMMLTYVYIAGSIMMEEDH